MVLIVVLTKNQTPIPAATTAKTGASNIANPVIAAEPATTPTISGTGSGGHGGHIDIDISGQGGGSGGPIIGGGGHGEHIDISGQGGGGGGSIIGGGQDSPIIG